MKARWLVAGCLALFGAAGSGCGTAEGAGDVTNPEGEGGSGGGLDDAGSDGASDVDQTDAPVQDAADAAKADVIEVPVPDPFQPAAGGVGQWNGKLPPGGLFDQDVRVTFPKTLQPGTKYPLVVFAHDDRVGEGDYQDTLDHIAKFGYVVASVDYSWNLLDTDHHSPVDSMVSAIDLLVNSPPQELQGAIDSDRVAAMGHSVGGKAAIWMALEQAAIHAVVALDPVDDDTALLSSSKRPSLTPEQMPNMAVPALYLATQLGPDGLSKCVPGKSNACRFFEKTPTTQEAWFGVLESFGHLQFVDSFHCVQCLLCSRGPSSEHDATQLVARGLTVAFLEYILRGNDGYLTYLEGVGMQDLRNKNRLLDDDEQFEFCAEQ